MRIISKNTHGILDYLMSLILIASPWLLGYYADGAETWLPVALGTMIILVSAITDYRYSIARLIPMPAHLTIDFISGFLLAVSPWLFGFYTYVYIPHLILGMLEIGASLMTQTGTERTGKRAVTV